MIWFTSDQHFYHTNVIKYCGRPFATVEEMNEAIIKRFNEKVQPGDEVYHLGDFSMAKRPVELFLPRLNGTHYLIMGNHDHCHPVHYKTKTEKGQNARDFYKKCGFKTLDLEMFMLLDVYPERPPICNPLVRLHHMPYQGDHEKERYTDWRPEDDGKWLLHGHVHEKWKQRGRMINVGVDVWDHYPVSIEQIHELIRAGERDL